MTDVAVSASVTLASVNNRDAVLSQDQKTAYVSIGGKIQAYDVATGAAKSEWTVGKTLGGMDVTADGKYLVVTEREPLSSSLDQYGYRTYTVGVYRVDLATGEVKTYSYTPGYYDYTFFDVATMPNGSVVLTQSFQGSGWVSLKTLNLDTGAFTTIQTASITQDSILTSTRDHSKILLAESNISSAPVNLFDVTGTTPREIASNGSSGFNNGIQAISGTGSMSANYVWGAGLLVFDAQLKFVHNLANEFPKWQSGAAVQGLAFDESGANLFVLDAEAGRVVRVSTTTWTETGSFALKAGSSTVRQTGEFGNNLLITSDGHYLVVSHPSGAERIDLTVVNGTAGNDTLSTAAIGGQLYGLAGDDILNDGAGDDLLNGGSGRDTLNGGAGVNTLDGGAGDDSLISQGGRDTLIGGLGDDNYYVDSADDVIVEEADQGRDSLYASVSYTLAAGQSIELMYLSSGTLLDPKPQPLNLTGNEVAQIMNGNDAANVLTGLGGNDWLRGYAGDDTLIGGADDDTLDGGAGFDTAVFTQTLAGSAFAYGNRALTVSGADGTDTLTNIEALRFSDGQVVLAGSERSVDNLFYARNNADVYKAGIEGGAHYDLFGYKEGRDPNGFFSTKGYYSANADVRAGGINPLDHYHDYGWREGRDASASFDTTLYLLHNQDVAAAGIDPLEHYLNNGRLEGRAAYAAVGTTLMSNGFDAEYYLLANPDVGAAGVDAWTHYQLFGYKEGRDPNAWFDTSAYLDTNKDVAAAGINPLDHYNQFGWREGRDPSAAFDTKSYLAANPDVTYSPLVHFLRFGIYEGRDPHSDTNVSGAGLAAAFTDSETVSSLPSLAIAPIGSAHELDQHLLAIA